jgi:hypothetical protein
VKLSGLFFLDNSKWLFLKYTCLGYEPDREGYDHIAIMDVALFETNHMLRVVTNMDLYEMTHTLETIIDLYCSR